MKIEYRYFISKLQDGNGCIFWNESMMSSRMYFAIIHPTPRSKNWKKCTHDQWLYDTRSLYQVVRPDHSPFRITKNSVGLGIFVDILRISCFIQVFFQTFGQDRTNPSSEFLRNTCTNKNNDANDKINNCHIIGYGWYI